MNGYFVCLFLYDIPGPQCVHSIGKNTNLVRIYSSVGKSLCKNNVHVIGYRIIRILVAHNVVIIN